MVRSTGPAVDPDRSRAPTGPAETIQLRLARARPAIAVGAGLGLGDRGAARRGLADRAGAESGDAGRSTSAPASPTSPSARARSGRRTTSTARSPGSTRDEHGDAKIPIGAAQALAAGAGSAWVSTAGGTRTGKLPAFRLQRARIRRRRAGRPDRLRPSAPGRRGRGAARDGGRDPLRAAAARLQGGQAHGRIPLLRRLDGPDRRLREPPLRGERERLRARGATRRRDRAVQLALRRDRDPDPEPGPGRAARDDQPVEHVPRADAQRALG